jgi:penicillin amidase
MQVRLTTDPRGVPGIIAEDDVGALFGLGVLHGQRRPLQALLLPTAGTGRLQERLLPLPAMAHLDAIAHRLDLPARGRATAERLSPFARTRVDAYLAGLARGRARARPALLERPLLAGLPHPDPAALASGFLLSAYLGLAEGQERMERVLVEAVARGASPELLVAMFSPHLEGWRPGALLGLAGRRPGAGFAARPLAAVGGSNAWAVGPGRSASGAPVLAGDPHLQINQLPALFFEVRARVGDDYWLGATIPGLPGLAVGRNRHVAWSGTFSVADNVDLFLETLHGGAARGVEGPEALTLRAVEVRRRGLPPARLRFVETPRGVLEDPAAGDGPALSVAWSGGEGAAEAMQAYLRLPAARSAAEADQLLAGAHTLSLHFVLADRGGEVRYRQVGRVPRRTPGWSGLYPGAPGGPAWRGITGAEGLPGFAAEVVVSANEARLGRDGATLSTLAQPEYRRRRIRDLLDARPRHDVASMQAIQRDLWSGQAALLRPVLQAALPPGRLADALAAWDGAYAPDRRGAHAFEVALRAARSALAPELGGGWFEALLQESEVPVWWAEALDRAVAGAAGWPEARRQRLGARLAGVAQVEPAPWGEVQRLQLPHLALGGLGDVLGYDRGPFPLPGSIATVSQGNLVHLGAAEVAVGPAYRFVTDLGQDEAQSSLPGGVGGSPGDPSYDQWLAEHLRGVYHRLAPPGDDEPGEAVG